MIERKLCPECGGDLGKAATKCRCGWQATKEAIAEVAYKRCEHDPKCQYPARLKANDKWVCVVCYDAALRPGIRAA